MQNPIEDLLDELESLKLPKEQHEKAYSLIALAFGRAANMGQTTILEHYADLLERKKDPKTIAKEMRRDLQLLNRRKNARERAITSPKAKQHGQDPDPQSPKGD